MYNFTGNKPILHKSIFHKSLPIAFSLIILTLVIANASATTPLSIVSITPSNAPIDNGQSITITGTWAGGTAPYNAVWYTGPQGTTCPQEAANVLAIYNGLSTTSNSITVSPTTSNSYCLGITDSESPSVTQLSLNYTENSINSGFYFPQGVSFSPSGTYAYVTNFASNNVVIINTATNTVTGPITSGFYEPHGVAFSPSGTYAYVTNCNTSCGGSGPDNVVVINTASNTVVNSITSGFEYPVGIAFSPSGTYAYVTNEGNNNVVIINTATNTVVNSITSGFNNPTGVAFSPSGTYAYVTNFRNNNVVIINVATNTVTGSITSRINDPQGVALSPSGTYAYVTDQTGNLSVINTASNTVTSLINGFNFPFGVAFSPSGTYAYVSNNNNNNAVIINQGIGAETTNLIYSSIVVNPVLSAIAITPSNPIIDSGKPVILNANPSGGTTPYSYQWYSGTSSTCSSDIAISGATSQTYSANPASPTYYCYKVTDSATTPENVISATTEVFINPDLSTPVISPSNPIVDLGQSVAFIASWTGGTPTYSASLYSSSTPTCDYQSNLIQQDIGLQSNSVTFSPVTTNSDTYYCVFVADNALDSYYVSNSISPGFVPQEIAISPSGAYAYVTNLYGPNFSLNGNVTIINLETNSITGRITSGIYLPYGVAFSPDGTYAYVTNEGNNNVVIINTASNTVVNSITSGLNDPYSVAISPSGAYAYVINCNSACGLSIPDNVVIINTATHTVVNSITSGFNNPYAVAISPSGTYAYVTNHGSNNVVIINTATNTVTGSMASGIADPYGVAFSPSGGYAYVASEFSNNAVIINTATNTVTGSITAGLSYPEGIAFSPDGTYAYFVNYNYNNVLIINTGTYTTNSIYSLVSINPTLSIPTISPSNTAINNGQSVTFSSTWSGGTTDYTAKLYSSATSTCNTGSTLVQTISSLTTGSTAFNPVTPTATTYYCVLITDSATIPVTVNSINSEVTLKSSGPQISNPYAGGPTGYFGPNSTLTSSTTSITTSSTTSTILPVTTIAPIIASSGTTKVCNDTSGYTVNYPSLNATIKIVPESGCFSLTVTNSTLQSKKLNRSVITALNYTVNNTNVSADATLHYSCSIPNSDVAPFILRNGTWHEITPFTLNVAACTVEFAVPSDPVIALLNTNITSTITTTTAISTVQTSVPTTPLTQQSNNTTLILILIIIVIIVIAALFIYLRNRR